MCCVNQAPHSLRNSPIHVICVSHFPLQLDCVAFAHLTQFIYIPFAGMKDWIETETPNLVALVDRIKTKFWPDWEQMCSSLELNTHLPKKDTTPDKEEEAKKEEAKKEEERKKKEEKKKALVIPTLNTPLLHHSQHTLTLFLLL